MRSFIKVFALIACAFTLMAFSCSKKKTIGEPYMLFEVHGTVYGDCNVKDESTSEPDDYVTVAMPVKGIKVSVGTNDPVYTNSKGEFIIYGRSTPGDSIDLLFEDVDGSSNEGPYLRQNKAVPLRQRDAGDAGNYRGYWFASGLEVKMLLKNESINPDPVLP